jgi:hypothetical protein
VPADEGEGTALADVAGALVAGALVAGALLLLELELALELQAATAVTRTAQRAIARHREPDSFNRRILVKRTIAFRLSAVKKPSCQPSCSLQAYEKLIERIN